MLYYIPFLIQSKPVIFGMVENGMDQEDKQELLNCIGTAGEFPVRVILFSAENDSCDIRTQLPNGHEIEILGQQGETFQLALTRSPVLRKMLRCKDLYANTLSRVKVLLAKDYKLSADEIEEAIDAYHLETFFVADADMAAHDSNEVWARRIYEFWSETNKEE